MDEEKVGEREDAANSSCKKISFDKFQFEREIPTKDETWPYGPVLGHSAEISPEFKELYDYSINAELTVGSPVLFDDEPGYLRYKGKTDFADGEWFGVELTKP
eukprot:Awhi_evm1s14355